MGIHRNGLLAVFMGLDIANNSWTTTTGYASVRIPVSFVGTTPAHVRATGARASLFDAWHRAWSRIPRKGAHASHRRLNSGIELLRGGELAPCGQDGGRGP